MENEVELNRMHTKQDLLEHKTHSSKHSEPKFDVIESSAERRNGFESEPRKASQLCLLVPGNQPAPAEMAATIARLEMQVLQEYSQVARQLEEVSL